MRVILLSCAIALSTFTVNSQTPAAGAQIVGHVIDADTNAPIAGARVMVSPTMRPLDTQNRPIPILPGPNTATMTDQNGRFVVDGIPPGRVRVSVQKQGYTSDLMDMPTIDARAGQATQVNVSLRRGGVLAGRIFDERGEPVSDIRVIAVRRIGTREERTVLAGPGSVTNDLGEFRLAGLAAGEYMLSASGLPQSPFSASVAGGTTWAPTYYPGTTSQAEAQVVTLPQADTVAGLEFRLISVPAFRVSGIAVDEAGKPVADAIVTLSPSRRTREGSIAPPATGHATANGTFVIGGVIAGSYVVMASRMVRSPAGGGMMISGGMWAGINQFQQEVHVDGADVTELRVIVASPRQ